MPPKNLKTLTKTWYKKLKDSGFNDIEQENGLLKDYSNRFYRSQFKEDSGDSLENKIQSKTLINEAKEEYYRLAGQFLHEHNFNSLVDRHIWKSHSEGLSSRAISKNLRIITGKTYNKDNVSAIIKSFVDIMLKDIRTH